jgi:hypothetical protein
MGGQVRMSGPSTMRNCDRCGDPFAVTRPHARFCSARCRVAANRDSRNKDGVTQPASAANVVPLRPRHAEPVATRQTDVVSLGAAASWRCACCHWLQAVANVEHCEFCGWPREREEPGDRAR